LIEKLGAKTACIISAIAFGVYHWFSYNAFGNPVQMTVIFFMTAIWGWMFAFAFAKTKTLYLPVALHFGWNLVSTVIFSQGPLGNQLLVSSSSEKLDGFLSWVLFAFMVFALPLIVYWFLRERKVAALSVQNA
jgi:membrane protease YdiL (CAAX protease family)